MGWWGGGGLGGVWWGGGLVGGFLVITVSHPTFCSVAVGVVVEVGLGYDNWSNLLLLCVLLFL